MAYAILRIQKLKGAAVGGSDQHTERERETLNADAEKLKDNIRLIGEPDDNLRDLVDRKIKAAGGKPRKDSVECVEFLMTASKEYFCSPTKTTDFAEKSLEYISKLEERGFKFVKAVMHNDEMTPHIAAYAVPPDPDGKLNAKYHLGGNRWRLSEYQDEFAEVMEPLGLERGIKGGTASHEKISRYYGKIELYDRAQTELAAQQSEELMRQALQATSDLLQKQMDNRADLSLLEATKAFVPEKQLQQTSQGLAILQANDGARIRAVITPDNKAFDVAGNKISDGSSIALLQNLSGANTEKVLNVIENKYDEDTKKRAARATETNWRIKKTTATKGIFPPPSGK